MKNKYRLLLEPGRIGKMELRNRIVMPGMGTNLASVDGEVTEQLKDHYEERARGGAGLIIVESSAVDFPRGKNITRSPAVSDDRYLPGLSALARAIQRHGAKAALQLNHGGRHAATRFTNLAPVAPSPVPMRGCDLPRELTTAEIKQITERFAEAALRAKRAGFNAVEIHAAHDYLLCEFLSSSTNKRSDEYGGSHKNRARFLIEVIQAVRGAVGADFPVWVRIDGRQYGFENGITLEESTQTARMIAGAGVDAIHVTAYGEGNDVMIMTPETPGALVPLAAAIKQAVSVPVITVGRLDHEVGARVLREGKADFISMGRRLIADPELPNKVAAGRLEDITPCTACLACIDAIAFKDAEVQCRINASARKTGDYKLRPALKVKKVLVIGGGPAGMEAARVAALRGHDVRLWEKTNRLGGKLLLAAVLDEKKEQLIRYLTRQVKNCGVAVTTGKAFHPDTPAIEGMDAVVLAVGAKPAGLEIKGSGRDNVIIPLNLQRMIHGELGWRDTKEMPFFNRLVFYLGNFSLRFLPLSMVRRLTHVWLPFGKRVIIIGGNMAGCQLAEFLLQRGRRVTIVEHSSRLAPDMETIPRFVLLNRLRQSGAEMLTNVAGYREINRDGLVILNKEQKPQTIEADTIIPNTEPKPEFFLDEALKAKLGEAYAAGDFSGTNRILEAIRDGYRIGNSI